VTIRITVAAPFKHTRKTGMRKNELVYYYALDRKWMSTEQANQLLQRAEEDGLIGQANGVFSPRFDIRDIIIPVGFKPTSSIFERNDPSQELIGRIANDVFYVRLTDQASRTDIDISKEGRGEGLDALDLKNILLGASK
jgi:hypothetical protein